MTGPSLKYQLLDRIGGGEQADVYRARALGVDRPVAVKVLKDHVAQDASAVADFLAEAALVEQLQHVGVVEMIDYGVYDGRPLQVLALIDGPTLAEALSDARPPVEIALLWARDVAEALDYVHHAVDGAGRPMRVVHRDISPHNLLLSRDGRLKVTDFGIARSFRRRRHTALGAVRGTLPYMAPEQMRGEPIDGRADIYALGCVLFEMLVGHSPVASAAARDAAVAGEPASLDGVPAEARDIIRRATDPWPRQRYDRAQAMAADCSDRLTAFPGVALRRRAAAWGQGRGARSVSTLVDPTSTGPRWLSRVGGPTRVFVASPTDAGATLVEGATLELPPPEPPTLTDPEPTPPAKHHWGQVGLLAVVVAAAIGLWLFLRGA